MAITVITTVGGETANSYVTPAEVDAHAESTPWATDWDARSADEKKQLVLRATRAIDALRHQGWPVDDDQALEYPRYGIVRQSGAAWESDEIPAPILTATMELASWLSSKSLTEDVFSTTKVANIKRKKLVDVLGETEYFAPPPPEGQEFMATAIEPILAQHGLLGAPHTIRLTR